jgi:hypothetical protein
LDKTSEEKVKNSVDRKKRFEELSERFLFFFSSMIAILKVG